MPMWEKTKRHLDEMSSAWVGMLVGSLVIKPTSHASQNTHTNHRNPHDARH